MLGKKTMQPPKEDVDRGYAWVVLAACFSIEFLYGLLICSVGVLTPAFLEEIDNDLVQVSWIGSTLLGTFTMCGPFVGSIEGRLGHRLASFLGGIMILVGLTSASLCRTVTGLILTFGVITDNVKNCLIGILEVGLGCGLAANVSGVAPGDYFNKRLPVAYGICMSGGALGLLVVGPLTIFLLEVYTLSGTLLILGAIGFHVCLAGALLRPSSTLMQDIAVSEDDTDSCVDVPQGPAECRDAPQGCADCVDVPQGPDECRDAPQTCADCVDVSEGPADCVDVPQGPEDLCAQSETIVTLSHQEDDGHIFSSTDNNDDREARTPDPCTSKEDNSGKENASVAPLLEQNSPSSKTHSRCRTIREHVASYGANGFFLYLFSVLFWSLSEATCMVHLPHYAELKGSTPAQSASLFTGMGIAALFSGMLSGLASSDKAIGSLLLYVGFEGMSGVSLMLLPVLSHTYHLQMVACVLFGLYSQGPYTLVSPICIELIGRSKLAVAYGMWSFVLGIGLLCGPPIASLIYANSGDYDYTFIFAGCCNLASAFFATCIPVCKKTA
ncbi:monocarboxylate transporter 12-like isoform X2 [Haliotis rubra]|uniref:monocarboxylate transporter 12-like isoform X2 n=1 Tax=Haliotis rubra TaxID=36100 RepID=UPI001EE5E329|nr:monocarboxylate transporter 12-like isoform X2 [Haliotis rubra]